MTTQGVRKRKPKGSQMLCRLRWGRGAGVGVVTCQVPQVTFFYTMSSSLIVPACVSLTRKIGSAGALVADLPERFCDDL